jgi:hypothetical protein
MGINLLAYNLEIRFCGCGCECSLTLLKGAREIATLGPMPVDFSFCLGHLDAMLVLQNVPEDEQFRLKAQLENAFKQRAELLRRQIVEPSFLAKALAEAAPGIFESCRKCTGR